jgi:hypothetical protein
MTQHLLQGRQDSDILWYQRRDVLKAAAAWVALGGLPAALAQQRSNIVRLNGDATLNGARLSPQQTIQTGDEIQTGPGASLIFVIGNASFHVRQNSSLSVERGPSLHAVSLLRLLTGAVASVWGPGTRRSVVMPTLTAGIRGTGVYAEIFTDRGQRDYFCNCYGTVELGAGSQKQLSHADYHQAFWADRDALGQGQVLSPAPALNHSDEELEFLAGLVAQRTAWQVAGRKGNKDGSGSLTY